MPVLSAEDHNERRKLIGASDIPVILGLSRFKSAEELWQEKAGLIPSNYTGSEAADWGHRLEPVILQRYTAWLEQRDASLTVRPAKEGERFKHPIWEWAACSPDGLVYRGEELVWGVEVKNRDARYLNDWGPDGSNVIPPDVEAQVRWSMFVTGLSTWDVAVLIGGNTYRHYTVRRDTDWEDKTLALVTRFREGYFGEDMGDITEVARVWEEATGLSKEVRHAEPAEEGVLFDLIEARLNVDRAISRRGEVERRVKQMIGRDLGVAGEKVRVLWSPTKGRTSIDWKAVAESMRGTDPDRFAMMLEQHTRTGQAGRRFTVSTRGMSLPADEGNDE